VVDINACQQSACEGGIPGPCKNPAADDPLLKDLFYFRGKFVTCWPNFVAAAQVRDAYPQTDAACWDDKGYPKFVVDNFLRDCHSPRFKVPSPDDVYNFAFGTIVNPFAHAAPFSNFQVFYAMLYSSKAGDLCQAQFGPTASGGPDVILNS